MDHTKYLYQYLLDSAETEVLVYLKNGQQIPTSIFGFFKNEREKKPFIHRWHFCNRNEDGISQNDIFGNPIGMLIDQKEIAQIVFKYSNKSFQF
jgi:hypothetical protein